ncbi:WD40-repeat-containing domain protein [Gloeopeniophorella convolvens]|nr:WD40-repeat-containing domain protein [Gloeopeniophorella convolvens]
MATHLNDLSFAQPAYTYRVTNVTILPLASTKISRVLELVIDGEQRTIVHQESRPNRELFWDIKPPVIVLASSLIILQPHEARSLLSPRRRKLESVEIHGDAIIFACSVNPGERTHEYVYLCEPGDFSVTFSITAHPETARPSLDDAPWLKGPIVPSPQPGSIELQYGPQHAPNSFRQAFSTLLLVQKALEGDTLITGEEWKGAEEALKGLAERMPSEALDLDFQELGDLVDSFINLLSLSGSAPLLRAGPVTVGTFLKVIPNICNFVQDFLKHQLEHQTRHKSNTADTRKRLADTYRVLLMRLRRNFEERKNVNLEWEVYHKNQVGSALSGVATVQAGEVDLPGTIEDEDERLANWLYPTYFPDSIQAIRCLDGTRTAVSDTVNSWLADRKADQNIMWITGSPGTGKTAVARKISSHLDSLQRNGCTLFSTRDRRSHPAQIWGTVGYFLALFDPAVKASILKYIDEAAIPNNVYNMYHLPVQDSFQNLLLPTFASWQELGPRFKLIVVSRAEERIEERFRTLKVRKIDIYLGEDNATSGLRVGPQDIQEDMSNYVKKQLPATWPEIVQVDKLTKHAGGFMLWAKAAMDYIESSPDPDQALSVVTTSGPNMKYSPVDDVFEAFLLDTFPTGPPATFHACVGALCVAKIPLSVDDLAHLLEDRFKSAQPKDVCMKLLPFLAIKGSPEAMAISHPAFTTYLSDEKRCRNDGFAINLHRTHRKLTITSLRLMMHQAHGLKFNIGGFTSSHIKNEKHPHHGSGFKTAIPPHLSYACRFWAEHLHETEEKTDAELLSLLRVFFRGHFLHWLEVMSLCGAVETVSPLLTKALEWLKDVDEELVAFVADAIRFVINFQEPISASAPHIYLSALVFAPSGSKVAQQYVQQYPKLLRVLSNCENEEHLNTFSFTSEGFVYSLSLSHDLSRLAICGGGGEVHLRDSATGDLIHKLTGHASSIYRSVWSKDDKFLITASADSTVKVWDAGSGTLSRTLEGHTDWVRSVALSPKDDDTVATASDDTTVRFWSMQTGKQLYQPSRAHRDWVREVVFMPDGEHAISAADDLEILVWSIDSGRSIRKLVTGLRGYPRFLALFGDILAVATEDPAIDVFDIHTGKRLLPHLNGHSYGIAGLSFSPDGKYLASCSDDRTIRLWDAQTGAALSRAILGQDSSVSTILFADQDRLLSAGSDGSVRTWSIPAILSFAPAVSAPFRAIQPVGPAVVALDPKACRTWRPTSKADLSTPSVELHGLTYFTVASLSPDGTRAATSDDKVVLLWDTVTGKLLHTLDDHRAKVITLCFSQDGNFLASSDSSLRVWKVNDGTRALGPLEGHSAPIGAVALSRKYAITGSNDRTVRMWSMDSGESLHEIPTGLHDDWIRGVSISRDESFFVAASEEGAVVVYSTETGKNVSPIFKVDQGTAGSAFCLALSHSFSSDGLVAIGTARGSVIISRFSLTDREKMAETLCMHQEHTDPLRSLAFMEDTKTVVTLSSDGIIRIIAVPEQKESNRRIFLDHSDWVHAVAISPDLSTIASGGDDGKLVIRDMKTGDIIRSVEHAHEDWIRTLSFSPDSELLVSTSDDEKLGLKMWNARDGTTLFSINQATRCAHFTPTGSHLVTTRDNVITIWDVSASILMGPVRRQTLSGHSSRINAIAHSHDTALLASGDAEGNLAIWNAKMNPAFQLHMFRAHASRIHAVAFCGMTVVSSSDDSTIRIWSAETGESLLEPIHANSGPVFSVAISADGKRIAAGGEDRTVRVFDAHTGHPLHMPLRGHEAPVLFIDISPDGQTIASSDTNGVVSLWRLDSFSRTSWPDAFLRRVGEEDICTIDDEGMFGSSIRIENGWIRGKGEEYLFWVPPMHRHGLRLPNTLDTIGNEETAIDFRNFVHGSSWTRCRSVQ